METPLDALLAVVLRAGLAHPTPAGTLSALRAAHGLVARYAPPDPPDDADDRRRIIIPVGDGECWCAHCGEIVVPPHMLSQRDPDDVRASHCCGRPQPVPVVEILQPEEYYTQ